MEIEAEINQIRSLRLDELRARWRATFRSSPPPAFTKDLVVRFLCWHLQEQAFGGLDSDTAKLLDRVARGDRPGADRRLNGRCGAKSAHARAPTVACGGTARAD